MAARAEPPSLVAELLYEHTPAVSLDRLKEQLAASLPKVKLGRVPGDDAALLFSHEALRVEEAGKKVPPGTVLIRAKPPDPHALSRARAQTWDWPGIREVVEHCKRRLILSERSTQSLDPKTRIELFHGVLVQVLQVAPPVAVHMVGSERLVNPAKMLRAWSAADPQERAAVFFNVRLFRIEDGQPGDVLMDTRGLAVLGLPDLQIHFNGLDQGRMATHLYSCAYHVLNARGPILDGQTVQGLTQGQQWVCRNGISLLVPKRPVIDLDPGNPFAAGPRAR